MLYFVIISVLFYFTYPTQTNVNIVVEYPMRFPAVTVCSYAGVRYDLIIDAFINFTKSIGLTSANTSAPPDFSNPLVALAMDEFIIGILNEDKSIVDYVVDLEELLFSCTYNSLPCNASDFVQVSFLLLLFTIFPSFFTTPISLHPRSMDCVIRSMRRPIIGMVQHHIVLPPITVGRVFYNWNSLSMIF
jgi:hypothetical protein